MRTGTPVGTDVEREIYRWSSSDPSVDAPPFLLSSRAYAAVQRFHGVDETRFAAIAAGHRAAVERHLAPVLREIVECPTVGATALRVLAETMRHDPIQAVFAPPGAPPATCDAVLERIRLVRLVWGSFAAWWRAYFSLADTAAVPMVDLWQLYIPFAEWIMREKRRRRPGELFVIGFNGSPGAGKTVLTSVLAVILNHLLDVPVEGRAITRSGDDWYLGRSDREPLRDLGYDCGAPGVTNRALPGTHDLHWLRRNLSEMERSTGHAVIRMGNFDKKIDDQPPGPGRFFEVRGRVGVFLFDLWFAGADTDVEPAALPDGLRRRVAENLRSWKPVFDRMDALWAFGWSSYDQMLRDREAQECLVEQRRGQRGMSREAVRAFMAYMIELAWDWRTTSPVPPDRNVTFRAWRDPDHRVIALQQGGRAQ